MSRLDYERLPSLPDLREQEKRRSCIQPYLNFSMINKNLSRVLLGWNF